MCENAKVYNEQKSQIYRDANTLQKLVEEFEGTEPPKPASQVSNGRTQQKRTTAASATPAAPAAPDGGPDTRMEEAMMRVVDGLLSCVHHPTYASSLCNCIRLYWVDSNHDIQRRIYV